METSTVGREAFANGSARRYTTTEIPGVGPVRIRSLLTSEYVRIEGLATRALQSLSQGKKADAHKFLLQGKVVLVTLCVVDSDGNPLFNQADAAAIQDWDYGLLSAVERACSEHCGIDGFDLEDTAKNFGTTPGTSSPTD